MDYAQNLKDTQKIGRDTIQLMTERDIPMVPQNYEICFAYFANQNAELTETLKDFFADPDFTFTKEVTTELHNKYFDKAARLADTYWDVGDQMQIQMSNLMDSLGETLKHTADYGATLSNTSGDLEEASTPAHFKSMVDKIVAATKEMEGRNKALESQLENSTHQIKSLQDNLEEIRHEALTDALTGLPNRKAMDENMRKTIAKAGESGGPLCLLFLDVDHFKKFNDTWGHQTGDTVLKLVAHCLKKTLKGKDMPARFGGEEFAVLLPETSLEDAEVLANNIRVTIANKKLQRKSTGEDMGNITISIGAALYKQGESSDSFIQRADSLLYAAKNAGRNRVMTEEAVDVVPMEPLEQNIA